MPALLLAGCLGGPLVGDNDDRRNPLNPSNRRVVLAPQDGAAGIRLIDPANPGNAIVIEANNVEPIAVAVHRTRDANGAYSDQRSDFVVYEKEGRILKVDLAGSANATAGVQVSSETEACGAGTLFQNDPDTARAVYLYTAPGPDDACGNSDDERRAVRLGMSATDTPLLLPRSATLVTDLADGSGALVGWLMFSGATLARFDVNFATSNSVQGGAAVTTLDQPKSRDATGVLFQTGNDLRYYNFDSNILSNPLYTKNAAAQFGKFAHDATRTYFTESEANETRIRALPTSGGNVALLQQQAGNSANSLALTTNRVISQQPDGSIRSVVKDGSGAVVLRTPAAGAALSFEVVNNAVVITETNPLPTLFIHGEASSTPSGSTRTNTDLSGFTASASGNLFGTRWSKIIAVRRLTNALTDASGALISLDPATAVEVNLGTLSTQDVEFVTEAQQSGDFSTGFSLSPAGGSLQRLFSFGAGTASSLRVLP